MGLSRTLRVPALAGALLGLWAAASSGGSGNPIGEYFASRGVRETIESVAIAFILAFLFRTFQAEAFVPYGNRLIWIALEELVISPCPTLNPRRRRALCPRASLYNCRRCRAARYGQAPGTTRAPGARTYGRSGS